MDLQLELTTLPTHICARPVGDLTRVDASAYIWTRLRRAAADAGLHRVMVVGDSPVLASWMGLLEAVRVIRDLDYAGVRIAVVVNGATPDEIAAYHSIEAQARAAGIDGRVFVRENTALAWLLADAGP